MNKKDILHYVDHTILKATTTWDDVKRICDEAIEFQTASVCIPPCYVKRVNEVYGGRVVICTVVGFPLGYNATNVKIAEARQAVADGAEEIDAVINLSDVKNGNFENILDEIKQIKSSISNKTLKVIIETCYLTHDEKAKLCEIVTEAGADYIKTSTGFGSSGANISDIHLFKAFIGKNVKIKASGGIRTIESLEMYIDEGCERIGTSSAVELLRGGKNEEGEENRTY